MYFGDLDMWIAYSDDLIHWTAREEPVLRPRKGYFDSKLVEPGPPPILTEEGILLIYNGANEKLRYSVGWVLFDKDDPTTDEGLSTGGGAHSGARDFVGEVWAGAQRDLRRGVGHQRGYLVSLLRGSGYVDLPGHVAEVSLGI